MARAVSTAIQNASLTLARYVEGVYGTGLNLSNAQTSSQFVMGVRPGKVIGTRCGTFCLV